MFIKEIAVTETMISQNPNFLTTSKTINQGELSDSQNWEKKIIFEDSDSQKRKDLQKLTQNPKPEDNNMKNIQNGN